MRVFIHTSELPKNNPLVLASYPDDSEVGDEAHGTGVRAFTVPATAIVQHDVGGVRVQALAGDWRERSERDKIFTARDRLDALHELLEFIMEHGPDVSKWPAPHRERQIEIKKRWKR